jgi:hypothetical protein
MHQLADTFSPIDRTANVWEAFQEIYVVKDGVAEPFGGVQERLGFLQNPLARLFRFELGNPPWSHLADIIYGDRAAFVGVLDAAINRRQSFGIHFDFVRGGNL